VLPDDAPSADPTPAPPPRTPARLRALLSERAEEPESRDADEPEPVEPPEPVVSAKATGMAAAADPTPRAIASAPTRPMERAYTEVADADSVAAEDDRPHSIARTRAGAEVRGQSAGWTESAEGMLLLEDIAAMGSICRQSATTAMSG